MTWTWPEQWTPAPMPMVGMRSRSVMAAASWSGISSRTMAKAPASWTASASASMRACLVAVLALDPGLAAHAVLGLGRPADVTHDRDAGTHERLDDAGAAHAALDLDRAGARLAHEPAGVLERLVDRGIGQEGHVAHDERALRAPDHGLGVVEHLVDGHAHRRFVAQQHLAQRVADEDHGDARLVHDLGGRVVVGGEHRDSLPVGMHPGDVGDGQTALGRGGTHGG